VPGPLCTNLVTLIDEASASADEGAPGPLAEVRSSLQAPLRVALAGRVSSGKSTIVNALVGQRVAATDVGECTRVVTWFHFGAQEHAVLTRRDGTTSPLNLASDGALPGTLGEDPAAIERIDVWLSSQALSDMTIIDTPGLASLTGAGDVTEELLALDRDSRSAISFADALVLVMAGDAHEDDVAVLDAFRDLLGGLRSTSINAIGALNKIDRIGGGRPDAIEIGTARAHTLASVLRGLLATVLPVVGLLAESTESGALRDADMRALKSLAALDESTRELLLLSVERFISRDVPVSEAARRELLAKLDITGVRMAVEAMAKGADPSATVRFLADLSGLVRLRHDLTHLFTHRVDALKAEWAIATLDRLTGTVFPAALAGRLEEILIDPAMHPLLELRALQQVATDDVLPDKLKGDLEVLVEGRTLRERLGLPAAASAAECQAAAVEGSRRWSEFANSGQGSPTARRVADTIRRSYDLAWQQAATGENR